MKLRLKFKVSTVFENEFEINQESMEFKSLLRDYPDLEAFIKDEPYEAMNRLGLNFNTEAELAIDTQNAEVLESALIDSNTKGERQYE